MPLTRTSKGRWGNIALAVHVVGIRIRSASILILLKSLIIVNWPLRKRRSSSTIWLLRIRKSRLSNSVTVITLAWTIQIGLSRKVDIHTAAAERKKDIRDQDRGRRWAAVTTTSVSTYMATVKKSQSWTKNSRVWPNSRFEWWNWAAIRNTRNTWSRLRWSAIRKDKACNRRWSLPRKCVSRHSHIWTLCCMKRLGKNCIRQSC